MYGAEIYKECQWLTTSVGRLYRLLVHAVASLYGHELMFAVDFAVAAGWLRLALGNERAITDKRRVHNTARYAMAAREYVAGQRARPPASQQPAATRRSCVRHFVARCASF